MKASRPPERLPEYARPPVVEVALAIELDEPDILKAPRLRPWHRPTLERLERFLSYGENWDGYGAKVISGRAVGRTIVILRLVALDGPDPVVVPLSHGGIQIEWYYNNTEIEIEVPPVGDISIFVVHPDGDTSEWADVTMRDELIWDKLRSVIAGL